MYRLEPTIDRTRTGEPKYIQSYAEPVNEDRILADHGSGKYKMILNFRKPGAERGDEIDTGYISVLNMKFPPKIAPGEWVDDPKNRKWSWAKQYFPTEQPQGNGAADPMKAMETYNKIRKDIVAEVQPRQSETDPEDRMLTLAAVIEKMVPKQDFNSIAALLKELRPPEDKLSQYLLQQHTQLMTEFLKTKSEGQNTNGIGMIREVVNGLRELLPTAKELIPGIGDAGGHGHRSRLNSWQELTVAIAPFASQILTPLSGMLAQVIMQRVAGGGTPGAPTHLPALPATTPATMMPFLQMIGPPMMNYARLIAAPEHIDPAELGADFASWVHEGFSANPHYDNAIVAARGMGTIGIMAAFRGTPLWTDKGPQANLPSLAELEAKLPAFFEAFLNWHPAEPGDERPDDAAEEVTTFSERGPRPN